MGRSFFLKALWLILLRLTHRAHIHYGIVSRGHIAVNLDLCKTTLVTGHILLQRKQQALGVFGGQYDATLDVGLLQSGECSGEVDDKL